MGLGMSTITTRCGTQCGPILPHYIIPQCTLITITLKCNVMGVGDMELGHNNYRKLLMTAIPNYLIYNLYFSICIPCIHSILR